MSEHQLYVFEAIDRTLTREEREALQSISSRAEITATRFTNTYNYGDLKADPRELLEAYFDAHYYCANWGERRLMFRFPAEAVPFEAVAPYVIDGAVEAWGDATHTCVELVWSDEEGGGGWVYDEEAFEAFGALIALREDILRGDHRALYAAWLGGLHRFTGGEAPDEDDPDSEELLEMLAQAPPPVPAGLSRLSEPLWCLMTVFTIDQDIVAAAARYEPSAEAGAVDAEALRGAVARMEPDAKDGWLVRVAQGGLGEARALLAHLRALAAEPQAREEAAEPPTFSALLEEAGPVRAERVHRETKAELRRLEEEARAAEEARDARLREVNADWEEAWRSVEGHIKRRNRAGYTQAAELMRDLRDAGARFGRSADFQGRADALRAGYSSYRALHEELAKVGLGA